MYLSYCTVASWVTGIPANKIANTDWVIDWMQIDQLETKDLQIQWCCWCSPLLTVSFLNCTVPHPWVPETSRCPSPHQFEDHLAESYFNSTTRILKPLGPSISPGGFETRTALSTCCRGISGCCCADWMLLKMCSQKRKTVYLGWWYNVLLLLLSVSISFKPALCHTNAWDCNYGQRVEFQAPFVNVS